ncbi:hypothetical protein [Actinocrispum wychmicini]|uniref:OmpA family protein n=1 Tax=Actinocrispum wychmicini TaxID=1213861 RepID=A0A4R2IMR7_9PSEU|nr:hypothetical protein [Actinocrispum wychmicini]TCO45279.1 hypothetical protein EV192_12143 [Actinocrispum wychmicini]
MTREFEERQAPTTSHPTAARPETDGGPLSVSAISALQRSAGNAAVTALLQGPDLHVRRQPISSPAADVGATSAPADTGPVIIFNTDSDEVEPHATGLIERFVVQDLEVVRKQHPNNPTGLIIDSWASTPGTAAHNLDLSLRRGEAVRRAVLQVFQRAADPVPPIEIRPHGATDQFDREIPLRNQRAVLSPVSQEGYRDAYHPDITCPGLSARKAEVLRAAGGSLLTLAIAMLETDNMRPNYPFGDDKVRDSACFGIFKQNWYFIRTSGAMPDARNVSTASSSGLGLSEADWERGRELNNSLELDVSVLYRSQAQLGINGWFSAHRWGTSGRDAYLAAVNRTTTEEQRGLLSDIATYESAVRWLQHQLEVDPTLRTDDRRFFVRVPAV